MGLFSKVFGTYSSREVKKVEVIADKVIALEEKYSLMGDDELRSQTSVLKERLAQGETLDDILPEAFATVREAAWRVLGMKHYRVQIIGGIVLHQGRIAEMKTGEGKTLVATLPAYLNALSGKGVHIVTVNDYLAKRDSEWMGKVYKYLGLTVGLVIHGVEDKKAAYDADITFGTNNEYGFDYLRDNMVVRKEQMVQRGHNFAIVDEVDSILIDEARTPLIISGKGDDSSDMYKKADQFAKTCRVLYVTEENKKEFIEDDRYDYFVDEKAKSASLTPKGVEKAERFFGVENYSDQENAELNHYVNQALKANGVMKRDVDYVVRDGEIIIVDEFTGRLMIGRRYNQGLHQAIEAKENVMVQSESKTLATITFQNFFRLYDKLSGMTGTALTEEEEFRAIYSLDVVEIPTNKPMVRKDHNDEVYTTLKAKYDAVVRQVEECYAKGQPVLVGTVSIEKSELLSKMLKAKGVKHNVLNAKHHEREAEIVAQAGKKGSVTIATNMAGRGTDIILGGNAEFMALEKLRKEGFEEYLIKEANAHGETDDADVIAIREAFERYHSEFKAEIEEQAKQVREAGGLYIIGTERHESRRIDNQLRGRAGRQGDPGESKFFISLEDDLMRLFGGDRIQGIVGRLNMDEDIPIAANLLSNTIENSQKRVEGKNFDIRKNVIQYDDVMNIQRDMIYKERRKVLEGENIRDYIMAMVKHVVSGKVDTCADGDYETAVNYCKGIFLDKDYVLSAETAEGVKEELCDAAIAYYGRKEQDIGSEMMRELERVVLLRAVDKNWMDHIDAMDDLRGSIGLQAYAQHDPVVEYRNIGYDMFEGMNEDIREDTVRMVFTMRIRKGEEIKRKEVATPMSEGRSGEKQATVRNESKKVGRNDPCPCGSGLKYKKCCGK